MKATIKYRGQLYKLAAAPLQGGFSDAVANSQNFKAYTAGGTAPGGYLGSGGRTKAFDQILEKLLAKQGLKAEGIASWLTSGTARHMMDVPITRQTPVAVFTKRAKEYTRDAARDVAIWSHPDHGGTMGSSGEIHEHLKSLFGGGEK